MDVHFFLKQLDEVEQALKCSLCREKCVNPVRIKVCGHYFCLKCFKLKDTHLCITCNTFYEERDIDYNNIAKETANLLLDLRACLAETNFESDVSSLQTNRTTDQTKERDCIFKYNDKLYHVNYIEEFHSKVNAKGETPLHIACRKKKLNEVMHLIEKKVDLNIKDYAGWAPLHEAVESRSLEIVEILLKHGALVNILGPEYITPLHKAVVLEDEHVIRMLLQYGADTKVTDYFGQTPVQCTKSENIKKIFLEDFVYVGTVEIFCRKKICAYCYYIQDGYKEKLIKSKLVTIMKEFDSKKVTHFIMRKTHKLSLKILTAMLEGCFLLPQEWIDDFLANRYFIPIPDYTFISIPVLNEGIKEALINSLMKLPKLFNGIFFYIYRHNCPVHIHDIKFTKESITALIKAGDGKILHRAPTPTISEDVVNFPYHSNKKGNVGRCCYYIIYEEENPPTLQYQMAEIKHKSSAWLINCIVNFAVND